MASSLVFGSKSMRVAIFLTNIEEPHDCALTDYGKTELEFNGFHELTVRKYMFGD